MNKIIGVVIALIVVLALFPLIKNSTEDFNVLTVNQSETAVEVLATPEVITLDNTPTTVNSVKVNGTALTLTTEYTVSGDDVTILANNSETDDIIVINYTYDYDAGTSVTAIMAIFSTVVLVGVLAYFAKSFFGKS